MGSAELILKVNAVGTVLINQAFLGIASRGMALVNVASVAGHQLPRFLAPTRRYKKARTDIERFHSDLLAVCNRLPESRRPQLAYVLSKNFVIWYSKALAAQFGLSGARVYRSHQDRLTLPWASSKPTPARERWLRSAP